jgi:DNA-binding ferritin-like protein
MSQNQQLSAPNTIEDVPDALTLLLAEMVALYVKTRNFHWHVSRPRFPTITCCSTIRRRKFFRRQT